MSSPPCVVHRPLRTPSERNHGSAESQHQAERQRLERQRLRAQRLEEQKAFFVQLRDGSVDAKQELQRHLRGAELQQQADRAVETNANRASTSLQNAALDAAHAAHTARDEARSCGRARAMRDCGQANLQMIQDRAARKRAERQNAIEQDRVLMQQSTPPGLATPVTPGSSPRSFLR